MQSLYEEEAWLGGDGIEGTGQAGVEVRKVRLGSK